MGSHTSTGKCINLVKVKTTIYFENDTDISKYQ